MEETSRSVPSAAPAGTLLTFAALGGIWAIPAAALVFVIGTTTSGALSSALLFVVASLFVAPVFGVPLGLATGAGALAGLAVRRSTLAAALGAGVVAGLAGAVTAAGARWEAGWWIPFAMAAVAAALTPLTLRVAARSGPEEPRSMWLMVAGLASGTAALLVTPVLGSLSSSLVVLNPQPPFGGFTALPAIASVLVTVFALAGAAALVVGLRRSRQRGAGSGVLVVLVAVISVVLTAVLAGGAVYLKSVSDADAAAEALLVEAAPLCDALAATPGVLDTPGYAWPTEVAALPVTLEAMKAYQLHWAELAQLAPASAQTNVAAIADQAQILVSAVESSQSIDRTGNLAIMSSIGLVAFAVIQLAAISSDAL